MINNNSSTEIKELSIKLDKLVKERDELKRKYLNDDYNIAAQIRTIIKERNKLMRKEKYNKEP